MKKLIFSIAALAAIVVMGSCSKDSDLTNTTASSKTTDSVTVSLNLNSGIKVSESSSSMTGSATRGAKTITTRAGIANTTTGNFEPQTDASTTYTAYFVATTTGDGYQEGNIVSIKSGLSEGSSNSNSVKVPNIAYKIYVTNDPNSSLRVGNAFTSAFTETTINSAAKTTSNSNDIVPSDDQTTGDVTIPLPNTLPAEATSTLYLFGETTAQATTGSTGFNATVNLYTPYAAVAVSKANDIVTGVSYGSTKQATPNDVLYSTTGTGSTDWYYMYIIADGYKTTVLGPTANTTHPHNYKTTNFQEYSAIAYTNISSSTAYLGLDNTIKAGNIYQYTVNKSGTLTITINAFGGTISTTDLDIPN